MMMRVSHHYYRSHLSMAEIGKCLGISRHRVGRLLKAAVATGVVNIEIRAPTGENVELRKALETAFKLKSALIVDVPPDISPDQIKQVTCRAAVPFLKDRLSAHRTIGVGRGSTTFELINALEPLDLSNSKVVQITGGNKRLSMQFDCHEVTRRLAQKLHVQPVLLHAPGIVDDRRTRELLMRDSNIRDTFKYFGELDLAIVGIGAIRRLRSPRRHSSRRLPSPAVEVVRDSRRSRLPIPNRSAELLTSAVNGDRPAAERIAEYARQTLSVELGSARCRMGRVRIGGAGANDARAAIEIDFACDVSHGRLDIAEDWSALLGEHYRTLGNLRTANGERQVSFEEPSRKVTIDVDRPAATVGTHFCSLAS
jgi:hypothetical protein